MEDWCCEKNGVGCNCGYHPDITPEEEAMVDAIMRDTQFLSDAEVKTYYESN